MQVPSPSCNRGKWWFNRINMIVRNDTSSKWKKICWNPCFYLDTVLEIKHKQVLDTVPCITVIVLTAPFSRKQQVFNTSLKKERKQINWTVNLDVPFNFPLGDSICKMAEVSLLVIEWDGVCLDVTCIGIKEKRPVIFWVRAFFRKTFPF